MPSGGLLRAEELVEGRTVQNPKREVFNLLVGTEGQAFIRPGGESAKFLL